MFNQKKFLLNKCLLKKNIVIAEIWKSGIISTRLNRYCYKREKMKINRKAVKVYLFLFCLFESLVFIYSYLKNQDILLNLISTGYGFLIFSIIYTVQYILHKRNINSKLITPGYVIYEVSYTTILKMSILMLMLAFSYKFFELNCKIIILVFISMVIFRLIAYLKIVDK